MHDVNSNTIAFADARHGWAVGAKGLMLKFEARYRANQNQRRTLVFELLSRQFVTQSWFHRAAAR